MPSFKTTYNFCPQCGKALDHSEIAEKIRPHCTSCHYVHWGDFSIGVGGVVWRDNKVLLVQRAYNPGKGVWTIPGGFVDQSEQISTAVIREVWEETGIKAIPLSIVALRDRPGEKEKHDAYIVFLLEDQGGTPIAEPGEVSNIGFFSLDECHSLNIAGLSLSAVEATLQTQSVGLIRREGISLSGKNPILFQITDSN